MSEDKDIEYYKKALEEEKYKNVILGGRLADALANANDKDFQLKRIKNNPLWKATKPARVCVHFAARQKNRIKNLGGIRGIGRKLASKKNRGDR